MPVRKVAIVLGVLVPLLGVTGARAELKTYQTKYYVLHADVDADTAREFSSRLNLMAEEYHKRTRGFAGTIRERLPVFAFKTLAEYTAAGGMPGTAGVFMGDRLMVLAGEQVSPETWHTVQHEGFHQFAAAAIGRGLPIWANEGLAEYFGEGVYTGDDFCTGLIPPDRLVRIQRGIREKQFRPLLQLMRLSHEIWNTEVGLAHEKAGNNYDQAWSMVHFLAQGGGGRYRDAFGKFLNAVSHGTPWESAWSKTFGDSVDAFQKRWEEYWLGLPANPTEQPYAQATTATLTSFLARAYSQRQYFDSFEEFVEAAKAGQLKAHQDDWLPPGLLAQALAQVKGAGEWSIEKRTNLRALLCTREDGVLEGRYKVVNGRVKDVTVDVKPVKKKRP